MIELHSARIAIIFAVAMSCCAAPGPEAPPAEPPKADAPEVPTLDPAHDLLARLEVAASDLRKFQAEITYWKWDAALERQSIYQGRVLYQVQPGGTRRFAIALDFQIVNDRKRKINKRYIFDGSWLIEIDFDAKLWLKRQIVPPGEHFDPLKLGEGPFPLPVGQPAKEVLARFVATSLGAPQDPTLAKALAETPIEGLMLVPRPGTQEAKDIRQAEIFYDPTLLLPVGLCLTETSADRKTVLLRDPKRNQGVDEELLKVVEPDPKEWRIVVEPFRE